MLIVINLLSSCRNVEMAISFHDASFLRFIVAQHESEKKKKCIEKRISKNGCTS